MRKYLLRNKTGFTLLEVLLAMAVLSFGISYISPIFFESSSAVRHIQNRILVESMMDRELWDIRKFISKTTVIDEHTARKVKGDYPEFTFDIKFGKVEGYSNLYKVDIQAFWAEGRKNVNLERVVYIRG